MSQVELIQSRHAQGLAAYRAGHGIPHLFEIANEIDEDLQRQEQAALPSHERDDWRRYAHNALPSVIAGFVDGLLGDIRELAARPGRGRTA